MTPKVALGGDSTSRSALPCSGSAAGRRNHWLVFLKDGHEVPVTYVDAVDHDQVMLDYRDAYAAMPRYAPDLHNRPQTGELVSGKATTSTNRARAQRSNHEH